MKLTDTASFLTEMGKPSQVCPKCGHSPIHKTHTYNTKATSDADKWKCKLAPLPGYPLASNGQSQQTTPAATTPAAGSTPPTPAQPTAATPTAPATPTATTAPVQRKVVAHTPTAKPTTVSNQPPTPEELREMIAKWLKIKELDKITTINSDNTIDIKGDADLSGLRARKIPVKINTVEGDFVVGGGSITSLDNFPDKVTGDLQVLMLDIPSFVGLPKEVGEDCLLVGNKDVTSIEGLPTTIGGKLDLQQCTRITSLKGIHKLVKQVNGEIDCSNTGVKEAVLGVMAIRGVTSVSLPDNKVAEIINKHLSSDDRDINACQEELIDAGYTAWAKM